MEKVSVTIITKNEEANIERCLKSLTWADEIVVVDSGSTDRTIEICKRFNCKLIETEWKGFGKTKKFAVDIAKYDWIFSIDADEEVTSTLSGKIKSILDSPKFMAYQIKRNSFYLGEMIRFCGWQNDYPLRLFNRKYGNFNDSTIHEKVTTKVEKAKVHEPLLHYTYPMIKTHFDKINFYTELGANKLKEKEKRYSIISALFFGFNKFMKMYFLKLGILDGRVGFILCLNSAIGVYLKYIKTWK